MILCRALIQFRALPSSLIEQNFRNLTELSQVNRVQNRNLVVNSPKLFCLDKPYVFLDAKSRR